MDLTVINAKKSEGKSTPGIKLHFSNIHSHTENKNVQLWSKKEKSHNIDTFTNGLLITSAIKFCTWNTL